MDALNATVLRLDRDQHIRLPARRWWHVSCRIGLIWITSSGDLHDWVLRPGESAGFSMRPLLIGALQASEVQIAPACISGKAPVPAWRAVAALLARRVLNHPPSLAASIGPVSGHS